MKCNGQDIDKSLLDDRLTWDKTGSGENLVEEKYLYR